MKAPSSPCVRRVTQTLQRRWAGKLPSAESSDVDYLEISAQLVS
jgi:hypothetical protein